MKHEFPTVVPEIPVTGMNRALGITTSTSYDFSRDPNLKISVIILTAALPKPS